MRKPVSGVPTRSDINRAVQLRKIATCLISDLESRVNVLSIYVAKTKALISFAVPAKLICAFVFPYAKIRFVFPYAKIQFSHDAAHMSVPMILFFRE